MKTIKVLPMVALACVAVALVGCKKDNEAEATHDAAWYQAHETEMTEQLNQCHGDPAKLAGTPNCINAEQAAKNLAVPSDSTAAAPAADAKDAQAPDASAEGKAAPAATEEGSAPATENEGTEAPAATEEGSKTPDVNTEEKPAGEK